MRRTTLEPPLDLPFAGDGAAASEESAGLRLPGDPRRRKPELHRERLAGPAAPRERLRRLFDPRGWVRSLERAASHALSRSIYPRIPGLGWPYGRILERGLTLSEAEIEIPGLAPAFDGVRALVLSDLHAGPFVSRHALRRVVERLMAVSPDVVFVPGDLVTARVEEFDENRATFERIRAPLGAYAVWGNHDHYCGDLAGLAQRVRDVGIELLDNRSTRIERCGQTLEVAGVDDLVMGRPDLDAALAGTRGPVVLLSHNPDLLFAAARRGVALMISGHTHAGQVRVPGLPVLVRQSRYRLDEGRFRVAGTEAVVSRGLGAVGVPLRLFCPPEAMLLTLRRTPA